MKFLLFTLDEQRVAIRADAVGEIVRAAAILPLPNAPAVVEGVVNVRGSVVPVFDARARFGTPHRDVRPADHFIVVRSNLGSNAASTRLVALHVDHPLDLIDVDQRDIENVRSVAPAPHVAGVAKLADGLAVIHDVDRFLSTAEAEQLDSALASAGVAPTSPSSTG